MKLFFTFTIRQPPPRFRLLASFLSKYVRLYVLWIEWREHRDKTMLVAADIAEENEKDQNRERVELSVSNSN